MGNKIVYSAVVVLFIFSAVFSVVLYQQQKNTRAAITKIETLQVNLPESLQKKVDATVTDYRNDLNKRRSDFEKQTKIAEEQNRKLVEKHQKSFDDLIKTFSEGMRTREKQHENELAKKFAEIDKTQKALFDDSRKILNRTFKDFSDAVKTHGKKHESELAKRQQALDKVQKDFADKIANIYRGVQERLNNEITASTKRFSNTVDAAFTEIKRENQKRIEQATKEIAALAKQKISGNEVVAREAYEKAQDYMQKGNFAMARLYCLNAINHAPNKKAYFETLIGIDKAKGTPSTQAELDAIRSVLELGLYQVDSKDIPDMMKMLASVNDQIRKISEKAAESQKQEEKRRCAEALASLKEGGKYAWSILSQGRPEYSVDLVRERLTVLESLSSVELSPDDAAFCRAETNKSNVLLGYLAAMLTIDNALTKAEKLLETSDPQFPAISSMVQTGNNVLSQLWNVKFDLLPGDARGKVIAQANRIARIEKVFNRKKSAPSMEKINSIYQKLDGTLDGNRTKKIDKLQEGMKNIMALLPEIYDLDCRRDVETKIGNLSDKVKEYSKERYEGYQKWAVKKCDEAFRHYGKWKRVDEDDAVEVVDDHLLEIDPACLAPAVSRLYQDVLHKQFAEMTWRKKAEMESKLATSTKKTIEDCPDEE